MKPHKDQDCGVCATNPFERNNYFYGKQFTVRDLAQEQSYFNDKRHLINRMILGWGVVCGLEVTWHEASNRLMVSPGMALDCCGREIIVCENKCVPLDPDDDDCCKEPERRREGKYVLCLEYQECHAEPISLPAAGCDEKDKTEYNRIREGFKFHLKPWDDACPKEPHDTGCPGDSKHHVTKDDPQASCQSEDLHHYLCRKLRHCSHECKDCDCVILATITIEPEKHEDKQGRYSHQKQDQKQQTTDEKKPPKIDTCTNRKLVYNNSLLYDLIYCYHGDLPHIVDFSWRTLAYPDREMPFDVFLDMIRKGVTIFFDQAMYEQSLNEHTFMLFYLYRETGTWTHVRRQIAGEIRYQKIGNCYAATFYARSDWIKDELDSTSSELLADTRYETGVTVEIVLRGSRIWSETGKGLDGEYLADKLPTGNGTQGGDFIDWFKVIPSDAKTSKGKSLAGQF